MKKATKPKINILVEKFRKILISIFYFAWIVSMSGGIIEAVFYPGVIAKHLNFDIKIIYLTVLVICLLIKLFDTLLKKEQSFWVKKLGKILTIFFGSIFIFSELLERIKFTNFVFSTFHFHPDALLYPFLLSLLLLGLALNFIRYKVLFCKTDIVFILLWGLLIVIYLIESVTYSGFVFRHFHFNPILLIYAFLAAGIYLIISKRKEKILIPDRLYKVNKFFFITISIFYLFLSFLDVMNYQNYVFSKFHIFPENLFLVCGLSLYPIFLSKVKMIRINRKRQTWLLIFETISFWVLYLNIVKIHSMFIDQIRFMVNYPRATYNEKMSQMTGKMFYDYVVFVKKNTPENSKLLIPPQAYPWPQTGNAAYIRYFLFPRSVENGDQFEPSDLKKLGIDYVLLTWGETDSVNQGYTHVWPKYNVSAAEVILMKEDGNSESIKGNYVYENYKDKKVWGLIKVKK